MRKLLAPFLALVLSLTLAGSALADGDVLQQLLDLSRQAQGETSSVGGASGFSVGTALVPDESEVQMDIDLETGLTAAERIDAYTARLEAQSRTQPGDFATLVKLGLAYRLAANHAKARAVLEQALALEPSAQTVYDALAKSLTSVDPGLMVYVGGKQVTFDVEPMITGGRTLVPIRAVADRLGAVVGWDPATFTATVTLNGIKVEVTRDSKIAKVNGVEVTLDVPATIVNGRTLLPLRFVSENLGQQVDYHAGTAAGSAVISIVSK